MENIIIKSINSESVQGMHLSEIDTWSLFFDSGCDYIDQLQHRIVHYEVFKAQFGEFSIRLSPTETFRQILASSYFWKWWATQLWRVCYKYGNDGKDEVYIRLMFNTSFIPQSTLSKIFSNDGKQANGSKQIRIQTGIKHRVEQVC